MSLFQFPRINFQGTIELNPGTANNDDYAGGVQLPMTKEYGAHGGQTLGLMESKLVEAQTYGMTDEAFIAWVQKEHVFDVTGKPGKTQKLIPAEWNYYGGMNSTLKENTITGIQTSPQELHTSKKEGVDISALADARLAFSGVFTDVNSEGSPPATQFFISSFSLKLGNETLIKGQLSKGVGQWLNFYRNINLSQDAGAGAYVYHVMEKNLAGNHINIPEFQGDNVAGLVFRYYLYQPVLGTPGQTNQDIEDIYNKQGTNPANIQIVGTIAPLLKTETVLSVPVGRQMTCDVPNLKPPAGTSSNADAFGKGKVALAPAVVQQFGNIVSADFSGTFPEWFKGAGSNDKWDFGKVTLCIANDKSTAEIGDVAYQDTMAGNSRGWIFDFDISNNPEAQKLMKDDTASLKLIHPTIGNVLEETDFYIVSNQLAIYGEQYGSNTQFRNQGTIESAAVRIYRRGMELTADNCPPVTVWAYASVPLQDPGDKVRLRNNDNFGPFKPLNLPTDQPGNFLITFTVDGSSAIAPESYKQFMFPPYVTNRPQINVRILPNNLDFSHYYVDPNAAEPVGNAFLTFDIVYQHVLKTYYLLYPVMKPIIPLNDESKVAAAAQPIIESTEYSSWMQPSYMPRTRDMSESRRNLLRAWCRKVLRKK